MALSMGLEIGIIALGMSGSERAIITISPSGF